MTHPFFHDAPILVPLGVFLTHRFETVGVFAYFLNVKKCPVSGALHSFLTNKMYVEIQFKFSGHHLILLYISTKFHVNLLFNEY